MIGSFTLKNTLTWKEVPLADINGDDLGHLDIMWFQSAVSRDLINTLSIHKNSQSFIWEYPKLSRIIQTILSWRSKKNYASKMIAYHNAPIEILSMDMSPFYLKNHIPEMDTNMKFISDIFCEAMGIEMNGKLFESVWSVRVLHNNGCEWYEDFSKHFIWSNDTSDVVQEYWKDFIQAISLKKAILHLLFQVSSPWTVIHTGIVQEYINNITNDFHYRGGYHNSINNATVWVSGSVLNEEVVEQIFRQANIEWTLDEIAEKIWCGRVDLLAGIWDELMARLLSHDQHECEEQIQIVVDDIKDHMRKGSLWLLC